MWFEDPLRGPIPAADGEFMLMLGRGDFFRHAMVALDLPELADDERFQDRDYRLAHADGWTPTVRERVAARPKMELFEALTTMRVAAGPVLSVRELATDEHLAERGFFVRPDDRVEGPRYPEPPARLSATPWRLRHAAPAPGADTAPILAARRRVVEASSTPPSEAPAPLAGLRVLALTQVWAGSYCAQQLALLGAEVVKIEARRRPDQWRGGYSMGILPALRDRPGARHGWNCHPSFNSGNLNQLGLTLDLQTGEGIALLRTLLRSTDIVVENFTPRVLSGLGVGYGALRRSGRTSSSARSAASARRGRRRTAPRTAARSSRPRGCPRCSAFLASAHATPERPSPTRRRLRAPSSRSSRRCANAIGRARASTSTSRCRRPA